MSNPNLKTTSMSPKPVILSAKNIHALPIESFQDPTRGKVTWRTLFSQPKTPTTDLSAGIAVCPGYSGYLCSHHHAQAEIYYILEGRGIVTIDGVRYDVEKGSAVFIPGDMEHSVENREREELKWLYVFPTGDFGDVVYHFTGKGRSKL
ncbi:RmlC-like cupin [Aspergillus germanicus]